MTDSELARTIIANLGGSANITHHLHCVTRLRFNLRDDTAADLDAIAALPGVLGTQRQNGQTQVVIGPRVADVYAQVAAQLGGASAAPARHFSLQQLFDVITGIFSPIIPALVAGGILKGLLAIVESIAPALAKNSTVALISMISDVPFYFLPVLLAVTAARRFKVNEFLGLCVAGAMLYPSFTATIASGKSGLSLFGATIPSFTYSDSVFPVILSVGLLALVYHAIDRVIPAMFKLVVVPAVALLITIPVALLVLAPLGAYGGQYLASGIVWLFTKAGLLTGFLLGFFMPLIVLTGMHQSTSPIQIQNIATMGYDYLLPISFAHNMAESGAAFGAALRMKNKERRAAAMSTSFSAFLGISEPALYTVNVINKTPLIAAMIANGIGGALTVVFSVKCYAFVMPGITSLPVYAKAGNMMNLVWMIVCIAATFVIAAGLAFALSRQLATSESALVLHQPVAGQREPLSAVADATFASGQVGQGFAVQPSDGEVVAPVAGTIASIAETRHAITMTTPDGTGVLLHLGIDTVTAPGTPFTVHVAVGDHVAVDQPLVTMDLAQLAAAHLDPTVIVTLPDAHRPFTIAAAPAPAASVGSTLATN
ncbi:glucose PTS transporter subunit IIA [Lacticaseibacillus nasuensis]|uniref:glucose PTS transporter subunit IIA n=1 Tax=Lacticaseibacillus nasuensis TaxID=944671 RepID=UPI0022469C4C|nr:glucose PTS transporter subunit IIA [Lacticaseibacillus nasuensis]MCX2455878.1 glucose PTS transporter subunit IIA [Lacticaseibacillus nasuensis]